MAFKKGKSGNPSGRPKRRNATDAWYQVAGYNTRRDKTRNAFAMLPSLSVYDAQVLWRSDDLAKKIIEYYTQDALRNTFSVEIHSNEDSDQVDPDRIKTIETRIRDHLNDLEFDAKLTEAANRLRGYGGAAILIGAIDNTTDWSLPLGEVRSVDWLNVLSPHELTPAYYYSSPREKKHNKPSHYFLNTLQNGSPREYVSQEDRKQGVLIHESRLLIFNNQVGGANEGTAGAGWGDSVLLTCVDLLQKDGLAWNTVSALLSDFSQGVYKIPNLDQFVLKDGGAGLRERYEQIDIARSALRAIVIDRDEDFTRTPTPITGLPELIDRLIKRVCAAAEIPITRLFRESPAGLNATGQSDLQNYYDDIQKWRKAKIEPQIRQFLDILAKLHGAPSFEITWPSLHTPTELEQSQARHNQAQTDQIYYNIGALSPGEIASSRFGGRRYSFETQIDLSLREKGEAVIPDPVIPESSPDPQNQDPQNPNNEVITSDNPTQE